MREPDIRDLLERHLMVANDIEEAFFLTLRDITLAALNSCTGESAGIGPERLDVVKKSIEAKCRMAEVAFVDLDEGLVLIPGGTPEAFLEIYRQFVATA